MSRRLAVLALLALAGCGRSSIMGGSPFDCPPDQLNPDGTCGHRDGGGGDLRDGGSDMRDGGDGGTCDFAKLQQCLAVGCAGTSCCACAACASQPQCPHDMGTDMRGDMGDMGDFCAD